MARVLFTLYLSNSLDFASEDDSENDQTRAKFGRNLSKSHKNRAFSTKGFFTPMNFKFSKISLENHSK